MPAPASVEEFLDLVQRSGVLDRVRLDAYIQALRVAGTLPTEPGKLAGLMVRDALLTYFQAEQLLQGKWKRFYLGKYKVLERLGSGGMGQVFLCEHKLMRRRVAVKVLPTAKANDPSSLDRFYREGRAAAALDHPNIVRAYDIDQDENLHFLVMEFVDGTNLQELVKKFGPLDVLRACHYVYGSAVGLQYAYEMGILHRDIKPANILVDRSGMVKILDMGLARFFNDEEDQLTKKYDENVLGTADYLAPEQAVDSHGVDIRADIYALGGTFYFLLAGAPPFPEGSVAQKLLWHQTREPKPVRQVRPEVPEGLAAIMGKMMAKEPADRYATPSELMAALAPWVQSPIPPPPERELPQFSPAALGVGSGGSVSRPSVSGMKVTGGARPPGATDSSLPGALPVPSVVAQYTPPAKHSPLAPSLIPPADAPGGIWESLASETRANAQAETGSGIRGTPWSTRRPPPAAPADPQTRRRQARVYAIAAVGGLLALAAAAYLLYRAIAPSAVIAPRAGPTESRTWYVTRAGDGPVPDRAVSSLLAAVQKASAGDTILLLDDRIDDPPIRLDANRFRLRDLTIEAGNAARSVRWTPAAGGKAAAVLEVVNVDGLRLRGLVIEVGGHFDHGISVVGNVPGLVVEDVTVRGPRAAGIRLATAMGNPDRPAELTRVRVTGDAPFDAGVEFAGDARVATKHVRLTAGRMDGPANVGVRVVGAATDIEVRHTRVFNVQDGVVFAPPPPEKLPLKVGVVGNTFHIVKGSGIRAALELPEALPHEVVVSQNYFSRTAALANAPFGKLPGLKADTNARDAESNEGSVPLGAIVIADAGLDLANPAGDGFLLPARSGPLSSVGPKQLPVGVPPQ